ncbi:hypothetical protein K431DRAFT_305277 [Polychaeton citri CBS 116435]|uniref:Uncharacterized protein n=1 Tax=Polychaeton citri CBS 116435 TaxID=1314669 RepID=A0A9P4Q293_9PEZI|nr:hypothetical protein K431DRAFT_305277 [Polychaeton citri CBS 116435]
MVLGVQPTPLHPFSGIFGGANRPIATPAALQLYGGLARTLANDKILALDEIVPELSRFSLQNGLHIYDAIRSFVNLYNLHANAYNKVYPPESQAVEMIYQRTIEAVTQTDLNAFADSTAFVEYLLQDTIRRYRDSPATLGQTQDERLETEAVVLRIFAEISYQNPTSQPLALAFYDTCNDFANGLLSLSDSRAAGNAVNIALEAVVVSRMTDRERQKCLRKLGEVMKNAPTGFRWRRMSSLGVLDRRGRELRRLTQGSGRRSSSPPEFGRVPGLLGPRNRRSRSVSHEWSDTEIKYQAREVIRVADVMKDQARKLERMVDW